MISKLVALATAMLIASPALAQTGDAAKGKTVFARCMACHSVDRGVNRLGPSLAGIMGRTSGAVPGFAYSPAMKNAKIRWDAKSLDAFLTKPAAKVPGSKMIFAGLPNPADRANLIAYLASSSGK
ncbi:cytochrome c family protein [Sphingobium sp. LB126]|uniref:c-type cytochrome n=1 Tax=Sphingobium sp. LB126 TaxID=1983755 RepID=UPI000C20683A|nr:cytochrome c family protein [Sphingobium sp. LB126]PJG49592.1 cytochrome c family protein [Sphingobium sp. LB126]